MAEMSSAGKVLRCPICKSAAVAAYRPFCSKRCADVDLGKWFTNSYVIPSAVDDDEAETIVQKPVDDENRDG